MLAGAALVSPRRSSRGGSCQAKCSFDIYSSAENSWRFLYYSDSKCSTLKCHTSALIGSVHHFNLGRRVPGFDYGPDVFGTGLTPLHLSDDGEGGAFHFQEPPPPYAAYKYPDIHHPDDPPPPYEASINPDSLLYVDLGRCFGAALHNPPCSGMKSSPFFLSPAHRSISMAPNQMSGDGLQADLSASCPLSEPAPPSQEREDSIDSSTLLVGPDTPVDGQAPGCASSLSTVV